MIRALIVIYNKKIDDSITYNAIKQDDRIHIIIYDNSSALYTKYNQEFCQNNKIEYYTQNENVGLSKAYNYVISKLDNNGYIIIMDDDTKLTKEYLNEVYKLTEKEDYEIILPIVKSNNKIISPANIQFNCRVKNVKKLNRININKITAINSGMVVKLEVYDLVKYNENIFLDYVDHDFMKQVRNKKYDVKIMNSVIVQNYSRFQKNEIDSELTRFKIFLKDYKIYCNDCHNLLFYYASTLKYRIYKFLKYKKIRVLITK